MENREIMQAEFSELGQALRHYSALRFAILTVFFVLVGGLITIAFDQSRTNQFVLISMRIGGLLATIVFSIYEYRLELYMNNIERRAAELEKALGYSVYAGRHQGGLSWLNTRLATRSLYMAVALFWVASFLVR